jgi:hypothetical protein
MPKAGDRLYHVNRYLGCMEVYRFVSRRNCRVWLVRQKGVERLVPREVLYATKVAAWEAYQRYLSVIRTERAQEANLATASAQQADRQLWETIRETNRVADIVAKLQKRTGRRKARLT